MYLFLTERKGTKHSEPYAGTPRKLTENRTACGELSFEESKLASSFYATSMYVPPLFVQPFTVLTANFLDCHTVVCYV